MFSKTRCRSLWGTACRWVPSLALLGAASSVLLAQSGDTAIPTVSVATPALNSVQTSLSAISGAAADDTGLKRVDVHLYRTYTGTKEYFNFDPLARTWGATLPDSMPVTPDANATGNPTTLLWSVAGSGFSWPTSGEMPPGVYNLEVRSVDKFNKYSVYSRPAFKIGPNDTTAPAPVISTPATGILSTPLSVTGTVTDGTGSGVVRLQVWVYRWRGGAWQYWTGSAWTATVTKFSLPFSTPDSNGVSNWSLDSYFTGGDHLPSGTTDLAPGGYFVGATAFDRYNNTATVTANFHITMPSGGLDTAPPELSVTAPTEGQVLAALTQFTGTSLDSAAPVADQTGISHTRIMLTKHASSGNLNWNGMAWQSTNYYMTPTVYNSTTGAWTLSTGLPSGSNLPSGNYSVNLSATDNAGNASGITTVNFKVNTRPVGTAQTLKVAKNVGWTVTLGATDANNDAIDSWRIVTPPAHGTLTGTAPNLTYTPANNYLGSDSFTFAPSDWEGEGSTATVSLTVMEDTTNPTAVILHPVATPRLDTSTMPAFDGTATDAGTGIASVGLTLYRDWTGSTQYWNGSSWGTSSTPVNAALEPADGNGQRAWSWPLNLPSGDDKFPAGRYYARAVARDYANRTVTVTTTFYNRNDSALPELTMETVPPEAPATSYTNLTKDGVSIFKGTMRDIGPGGQNTFGRLHFRLVRTWTGVNEFWTGTPTQVGMPNTGWSNTLPQLAFSQSAPDVNGYIAWQVTATMPGGTDLPQGRYVAQAIVNDTSGNTTTVTQNIHVGEVDGGAPTVSVAFPAQNAQLSRLEKIQGTASDTGGPNGAPASGLTLVNVRLRRTFNGQTQYWNGSAWTTSDFILPSRTEHSWIRNTNLPSGPTNLPAGDYIISAVAQDRYANNSSAVTRNFSIVANDPPEGDNQSVTATGHYGREGSPKEITLSASDDQGDAIESYHIVSQPTHGTVTEVGAKWVYVSDADYFGADSFTFAARDWGNVNGPTATVSINVVEPVDLDLLVKNSGATGYTGDDIVNSDATGQTVNQRTISGATAVYHFKLEKESSPVLPSLALKVKGDAATTGWTVTYYDALTTGVDITSAVTGTTGWPVSLTATAKGFRVEVTSPENLEEAAELPLLITATEDNAPAQTDTVKVVTVSGPNSEPVIGNNTFTTQAYVTLNGQLAATDADGDPLTYTYESGPEFGDVTINPDGSFIYYSDNPYIVDHFGFNVSDGHISVQGEAEISVQPGPNQAPFAYDGEFDVAVNSSVEVPLVAWDVDFDPLLFSVVTPPAHGTLSGLAPDLVYIPDADYAGDDSFTFKANDGEYDSAPATITLHVEAEGTSTPGGVDALIRKAGEANFIGNGFFNTTGANQTKTATVNPGAVQSFEIKIQNEGTAAASFFLNAPTPATGWTATYFDAATGGNDITEEIDGGWETPELAVNGEVTIRLELQSTVTAEPLNDMQFTVQQLEDEGSDVVALNASFLPPSRPDAVLLDEEWESHGDDLYLESSEADGNTTQTLSRLLGSGVTSLYALDLQNDGSASDELRLTAPVAPAGWTVQYIDANTDTDITAAVTGTGYVTPEIPAAGSLPISVLVTPTATASFETTFEVALKVASENVPEFWDVATIRAARRHVKLDLRLGSSNSQEHELVGDEVLNDDGANQSLTKTALTDETVEFQARLKTWVDDEESEVPVKYTGPAGDANWSIKYFRGVAEVTSAVTGAGLVAEDSSVPLRIEVKPLTAGAALTKNVLLHVEAVGEPAIEDAVLAIVQRAPAVDVSIRTSESEEYAGEGIYNEDGSGQSASVVQADGSTAEGHFVVQVTNRGTGSDTFVLKAPATVTGWIVHYFNAATAGTDITTAITGTNGWTTPSLAVGASTQIRVEVESDTNAVDAFGAVLVSATSVAHTTAKDAVKAVFGAQRILKLQYTLDHGVTWLDAPTYASNDSIPVPTKAVAGFRAVPMVPDLEWPFDPAIKPLWDEASYWKTGETVWIQAGAPSSTPQVVGAVCGNKVETRMLAVEAYEITVSPSQVYVPLNGGTEGQITLTATVTDGNGAVVQGVTVRFTSKFENGSAAGEINGAGTTDDEATTGADGKASVTLTTGSTGGDVTVQAILEVTNRPDVPSRAKAVVFGTLTVTDPEEEE